MAKGLQHVLSLNMKNSSTATETDRPDKMQILKHVFCHPEAKSGLKKSRADELLTELLSEALDENVNSDDTVDDPALGDGEDVMKIPFPNVEDCNKHR